MYIGGVVVKIRQGCRAEVESRLRHLSGVEIAAATGEGFALVLEGSSPRRQRATHETIASWEGVEEALVVFQSNKV